MLPQFPRSREQWLRIGIDVLLINLALGAAVVTRTVFLVAFEVSPGDGVRRIFWQFIHGYRWTAPLLTPICVLCGWLSGFYSHGRFYRGRYKALIVVQAVSAAYLIYGFLAYFLLGRLTLPRGMLLAAWLWTAVLLTLARLWSVLWRRLMRSEDLRRTSGVERRAERVLVIGGGGYIGSALLSRLLERGVQVRLLDLLLYGKEPIAHVIDHPRLELVEADFRQIDRVVEAMQACDAVIHLGGIVGDPACSLDESVTVEVNLWATRMIAAVAKGTGIGRFIFASTCSVYGAGAEVLDERSILRPVSLYARSKLASERVLNELTDAIFRPTCLRFGTIYGLSGRTRFDLVINLLSAKAAIDGEITVFGGDQWRPFLHVEDAARAVELALFAPLESVGGETFNVGSQDQNLTISEAARLIHAEVPAAKIVESAELADPRNYRVDFTKIRRVLHFEPQWTVVDGIRQVLVAVRGGSVGDYRAAQYSNVKFLTEGLGAELQKQHSDWVARALDNA